MRFSICLPVCLLLFTVAIAGCSKEPEPVVSPEPIPQPDVVRLVNSKCPIMGGKPLMELRTQYEGQWIGFCCDGCPEDWAELGDQEQADRFATVRIDESTEG